MWKIALALGSYSWFVHARSGEVPQLASRSSTSRVVVDSDSAYSIDDIIDANIDALIDANIDASIDANIDALINANIDANVDANIDDQTDSSKIVLAKLLLASPPSTQGAVRRPPTARRSASAYMGRKGRPAMPKGAMGASMQPQQQQKMQQPKLAEDGTPLLYLYCRTSDTGQWWPVTTMPGDAVCKGFVNNWIKWPFMNDKFYDSLLDTVARSVQDQRRRLTEYATKMYGKVLVNKENKNKVLQWGFKVDSTTIQEAIKEGKIEKPKIVRLTDDMIRKGLIDEMKDNVANFKLPELKLPEAR